MNKETIIRNDVANTILNQLGGSKFRAMTGAKHAIALESGVQFKIGGGAAKRINSIRIVLDPSDTYTVSFYSLRKIKGILTSKLVAEHSDIYADALRDIFTAETGFECTLGTLGR